MAASVVVSFGMRDESSSTYEELVRDLASEYGMEETGLSAGGGTIDYTFETPSDRRAKQFVSDLKRLGRRFKRALDPYIMLQSRREVKADRATEALSDKWYQLMRQHNLSSDDADEEVRKYGFNYDEWQEDPRNQFKLLFQLAPQLPKGSLSWSALRTYCMLRSKGLIDPASGEPLNQTQPPLPESFQMLDWRKSQEGSWVASCPGYKLTIENRPHPMGGGRYWHWTVRRGGGQVIDGGADELQYAMRDAEGMLPDPLPTDEPAADPQLPESVEKPEWQDMPAYEGGRGWKTKYRGFILNVIFVGDNSPRWAGRIDRTKPFRWKIAHPTRPFPWRLGRSSGADTMQVAMDAAIAAVDDYLDGGDRVPVPESITPRQFVAQLER